MKVHKLVCLLFSIALLASAQALETTCFTSSGAVLETSASPSWASDILIFNEKIHSEPDAVAYVYNQQQVQDVIKCAATQGIKVVPRNGGHSYEGYSVQTGKLVVDVTNMTDFQNNGSNITFGAGFRLGALALNMYLKANALLPAGTCPWVGASGLILGGGTGQSIRTYGLACDQLLGLTMVDYQGNIIQASMTENTDLLWASCGGGGGNLGIVTSFTVKMLSLNDVPFVTTATLSWTGYDTAVSIFDKAQRYFKKADQRLNGQLLIGFGGTNLELQYFGDTSGFNEQMAQSGLLTIPGVQVKDLQQQSFINATLHWSAGTMNIRTDNIYNLNMTSVNSTAEKSFTAGSSFNQDFMSLEGIQTMVNAVANLPAGQMAFVEHKFMLGAVSDIGPTDTAFYWRDSLFNSQWFYQWTEGDQSAQANAWLKNTQAAMAPYLGQGNYVNYVDPLLTASNTWAQGYYGGNLDRYRAVKTQYDPLNFFNSPITPAPLSGNSSSAQNLTPTNTAFPSSRAELPL